jgi:dimethylglycine dehydrogenase
VNAAGLWAKQVGLMAGVDLPVTPMQHHYLVTEDVPEIAALDRELALTVDLEGFSYLRQERKGALLGVYERNPAHWQMDGAPWDYGMDLIPEEIDRISPELAEALARFPALERAGIRRWVNGAFTFTPDGNPLVGPVPGAPGYWVACGVMAGFSQGGGVGKSLAEWMVQGEPAADVFGMDVARYGGFAANREYLRQTTAQFYARRFVMTYPNERLPAGRPLKRAPAHDAMSAAGCQWAASWGLEVPVYFAPKGFTENPTLRRSNAFDILGAEVRAVRETAGLIDSTGFARYEVSGTRAEAWLDGLLACRLPGPGQVRLAPMLGPNGLLKGDLTVFNWGDGRWWIMGSYYLRQWHMRWFDTHLVPGVTLQDVSDGTVGFLLTGPRARDILAKVTHEDISKAAFPFMTCRALDVGMVRTQAARLSVAGELGFELNCSAAEHVTLREALLAAGQDHGLREVGYHALNALRLEKSFGIWSAEFRQSYSPQMTGMDRWIDFDKGDFVGREAALRDRSAEPSAQVLVTLDVAATDADASGFEPVWIGKRRVGHVSSGGYGHWVGKSLALAFVDRAHTALGTAVEVHVAGVRRRAVIIPPSPHDPKGSRMRG